MMETDATYSAISGQRMTEPDSQPGRLWTAAVWHGLTRPVIAIAMAVSGSGKITVAALLVAVFRLSVPQKRITASARAGGVSDRNDAGEGLPHGVNLTSILGCVFSLIMLRCWDDIVYSSSPWSGRR
jgi:hypothetical protein